MLISQVPLDTTTLDEVLLQSLSNLGMDLEVEGPFNDRERSVSMILVTLGITSYEDLYRVFSIVDFCSNAELSVLPDQSVLMDLGLLSKWFTLDFNEENPPDNKIELIDTLVRYFPDSSSIGFSGNDRSKEANKVTIKAKDLPDFSGADGDWPQWKDQALAIFKISGLYEVVRNEKYAKENPRQNAMVHGLLVNILTEDTNVDFCCLETETPDDGYGAWNNLEKYYERDELLKFLVMQQHAILDDLRLDSTTPLDEFTAAFMRCKNRITSYMKKCTERNVVLGRDSVTNWKSEFLNKVTDSKYRTKKETCENMHQLDLWDTIIKFKTEDLEHRNNSKTQRKPGYAKDTKKSGKDKEAKKETKATSGTSFGAVKDQLLKAAGDDDGKKALLAELLATAAVNYNSKKDDSKSAKLKPKKKRQKKRRRMVMGSDSDDDGLDILDVSVPVNDEFAEVLADM